MDRGCAGSVGAEQAEAGVLGRGRKAGKVADRIARHKDFCGNLARNLIGFRSYE